MENGRMWRGGVLPVTWDLDRQEDYYPKRDNESKGGGQGRHGTF